MEEENEKTTEKQRKKKIYIMNPFSIIKIIAVIIIIGFTYFIGTKGTSLFKSRATVINSQFEARNQLITQVERITVMEDTVKDRTFFSLFNIPFTQSRIIFSYDVIIEAGIDCSKVSYVSENAEDKTLTLKVPHAEIFNAYVDYDSKQTYLDQDNLFSRITFDESESAVAQLVGKAKERAESRGDLTKYADENAKRSIEGIVKTNSMYKDYTIIYQYIGE